MAITGPWQFEWRSVLLGDGTDYDIVPPIEGVGDHPDVRAADMPSGFGDGDHAGQDRAAGRYITVPFEIVGTDAADLEANLAVFNRIMQRTTVDYPLTFQLPGQDTRRVLARVRRRTAPIDVDYELGRKTLVTVQWFCPDPFIYAETQKSQAVGAGGSWVTSNDGNTPAPFRVRFSNGTGGTVTVGGLTIGHTGTLSGVNWYEFDTNHLTGYAVDQGGATAWDAVSDWDDGIAVPVGAATFTVVGSDATITFRDSSL